MCVSIFHSRFGAYWLKEEFRRENNIDSNKDLSDKAKKYLKIIHDFKNKVEEPSKRDRLALQEAYCKAMINIFFPLHI